MQGEKAKFSSGFFLWSASEEWAPNNGESRLVHGWFSYKKISSGVVVGSIITWYRISLTPAHHPCSMAQTTGFSRDSRHCLVLRFLRERNARLRGGIPVRTACAEPPRPHLSSTPQKPPVHLER